MVLCFAACKKESIPSPSLFVTFSKSAQEGVADASGDYTLSGHISSQTPLTKITLTRSGGITPFLTDEATVKNKKEYDYSYPITGITKNTTIILDVYDQKGNRSGTQFLIRK
jgi:hypothetical protein